MTEYYDITKKLEDHFKADPFINSVTHGDITRIDMKKQTIFALAHIIVNSCIPTSNTLVFNISVILADLVGMSKDMYLPSEKTEDLNMVKADGQSYVIVTKTNHGLEVGDTISITNGTSPTPEQFDVTYAPVSQVIDSDNFKYNTAINAGAFSLSNIGTLLTFALSQQAIDNEIDVLNSMLAVGVRLHGFLSRGSLAATGYQLQNIDPFEPFIERFENNLAGWTITFDVAVANNVPIC